MAKKGRQTRTFARTAPKSQEKHLIENAKQLYDNPYIILPQCTDETCEKYFKKIRKRLDKIHRYHDSIEKLEKFSNKKGLDSAVAGTLLLAQSEKAPYLGVVSFPTGDVTYAHRGKADKEKLIAVQHFEDPVLRLLGIKDIAYGKGLSVYSWDSGFICTGKTPKPPEKFVEFIFHKLGASCTSDICSYPHTHQEINSKKESSTERFLRIHWKSANTYIAVCETCAKKTQNTIFTISKYLIQPKLSDDFDIQVIADVIHQEDKTTHKKTEFINDYLAGRITDLELIQKNLSKRKEDIQQSGEKMFILNNVSYGDDIDKFLDALGASEYERKALFFILEKIHEPLIVNQITPNKILERYWKDHGLTFIQSVIHNQKIAESFFQLEETPSDIIKLVFEYQKRQKILAKLPQYTTLSILGIFADTITKTYKTFGEKQAVSEIKKIPDTPQAKSLSYAFLLIFRKAEETKWKYSKEEIEYGTFLKPYAQKLLEAEPEEYTKYLKELLTACGSTENIT